MDTLALPIYLAHPPPLTVLYADLENHALAQPGVFLSAAGSVIERENASGFRFYAHQTYDSSGKKRERYVAGPIGDTDADNAATALRARIHEAKALVPSLRLLGREGFHLVDPRTFATLGSLHNHGVFAAGAVLVGSHAYGVLLNAMSFHRKSSSIGGKVKAANTMGATPCPSRAPRHRA